MRIKKAKDVKEANRLMKENVLILKEKIKEVLKAQAANKRSQREGIERIM